MGRRSGIRARDGDESAADARTSSAGRSPSNEELIEDRYAALQAWTEWTKIQENAVGRA